MGSDILRYSVLFGGTCFRACRCKLQLVLCVIDGATATAARRGHEKEVHRSVEPFCASAATPHPRFSTLLRRAACIRHNVVAGRRSPFWQLVQLSQLTGHAWATVSTGDAIVTMLVFCLVGVASLFHVYRSTVRRVYIQLSHLTALTFWVMS